jgi:hypothetical protein
MHNENGYGYPQEQERLLNKEKVIAEFKRQFETLIQVPFAYLVYGSVARGAAKPGSDIDSMLVFHRIDGAELFKDDMISSLPFERPDQAGQQKFFEKDDLSDIESGRLDFIRIEGQSMGEEIELQLFPLESLEKACTLGGGDLMAGKKNLDGAYNPPDPQKTSIEQTYLGQKISFEKKPRLAESGKRIDTRESGITAYGNDYTRGVTLEKLICPRIVTDKIGIEQFLDEKVLRNLILRILSYRKLFVSDQEGRPIGIKKDDLDYRMVVDFLKIAKTNKPDDEFGFGQKEERELKDRFEKQIVEIVRSNNLKVL